MQNRSKLFLILSLTILSSSTHANPYFRSFFNRNTMPNSGMPFNSRALSSTANPTIVFADESGIVIGLIVGSLFTIYNVKRCIDLSKENNHLLDELESQKELHTYFNNKAAVCHK